MLVKERDFQDDSVRNKLQSKEVKLKQEDKVFWESCLLEEN